ncbi:MAG: hydroxyethylthiazole kinase [Clostridiales bacterium]|nr:hydroxyethylthiazole kinase [Clostridiales bacterium]
MKSNEIVRKKIPLVHFITNYVTANDAANALLACGGSPIMADDIDECAEITAMSQALVLNIGTLNQRTIASMIKSGKTANANNIPVILDPVGAGASSLRNETTKRLLAEIQFTIIRGNLSEISFVAGCSASTRGVDSSEQDQKHDALTIAKQAATKYRCVCVVTGKTDVVTDGIRTAHIHNGVSALSKITGTGCMLSGIIGAYAGALKDSFSAACQATISMGLAGEIAYEKYKMIGTGSLHIGIIDALSQIDDTILKERGKIIYETDC